MPSGGRLRGVAPEDDDDGGGAASSTTAHALALTEDSDFGEMEDGGPVVGGAMLRVDQFVRARSRSCAVSCHNSCGFLLSSEFF